MAPARPTRTSRDPGVRSQVDDGQPALHGVDEATVRCRPFAVSKGRCSTLPSRASYMNVEDPVDAAMIAVRGAVRRGRRCHDGGPAWAPRRRRTIM